MTRSIDMALQLERDEERLGLGRHIVENSHVGTSIRTPIKNTIMYGAQPHSAVNEEQQRHQ